MKKIVIITGFLASGKSTFYHMLNEKVNISSYSKDDIKVSIGNTSSREYKEPYELGEYAFHSMLNQIEKDMQNGIDVLIEGAFIGEETSQKGNEQKVIKELLENYDYKALIFFFHGKLDVLFERFVNRENSNERNQILKFKPIMQDFRIYKLINKRTQNSVFEENVIKVDTTNLTHVDYEKYYCYVHDFLEN